MKLGSGMADASNRVLYGCCAGVHTSTSYESRAGCRGKYRQIDVSNRFNND